MNAKKEWAIIERMMVGDFNENHDPDNGQFTSGSSESSGKTEKHKEPAKALEQYETPKLKYKYDSYNDGIEDAEYNIRNNSWEIAVAFADDGRLLMNITDGVVDGVSIRENIAGRLKNSYFTHNHPSGTTFSQTDIDSAINHGMKQMRVCHTNGSFAITRQYEIGDMIPSKYMDFGKDYHDAWMSFRNMVTDPMWETAKNKTSALADNLNKMQDEYRNKWLKDNAKQYGWKYEEIKA